MNSGLFIFIVESPPEVKLDAIDWPFVPKEFHRVWNVLAS